MRKNIVFTLTGTDRTGLVEEITKLLLDLGGNVETSRMARLGGEFAVLMLVSIPEPSTGQPREKHPEPEKPGIQGNNQQDRTDLRRSPCRMAAFQN